MLIRAVIVFTIFVAASGIIARAQRAEYAPPRQTFAALPTTIDKWRGRNDPPLTDKEREILGADDYILRSYYAPGTSAGLYMGYWATQKRGDTVHSPLNCLPGSGWEPVSRRPLRIAVRTANASTSEIEVNRFVIQKGLDRQLVLYWYQSHGRVVASEYWGKLYLVADTIRTSRSDTAIVRVVVPIADASATGEAAAERDAVEFVQRLFPTLDDYIPS
jgi:EpsI family protein